MGQSNPSGKLAPEQTLQFKSFCELAQHLEQTGEDLERLVYPSLRFGAFFWIPDADTGFGRGDAHPWVIITPHRSNRPTVAACPRTSSEPWRRRKSGLLIPAGVVSGLDKDGVVLLDIRRPFLADAFRHYDYIGLLPEEWQENLRAALAARGQEIARESAEPSWT